MCKYIFAFLFCFFKFTVLYPSDSITTEYSKYGIFAGFGKNNHIVNFKQLDRIPSCCPNYESGNGGGFYFGLLYERQINNLFGYSTRLGYYSPGGILKSNNVKPVRVNNVVTDAIFEHSIEAELSALGFGLNLNLYPIYKFNIFTGLKFDFFLNSKATQKEKIITPPELLYDDNTRIKTEYTGDIPNLNSMMISSIFGISYDFLLPGNMGFMLSPEIYYCYGFNNLTKSNNWKIASLNFGLALKYSPSNIIEIKYEKIEIPKIKHVEPPPMPPIIAKITANQIIGNDKKQRKIDVFEYNSYVMEYYPLLPVVFFDKKRSEIPSKYYGNNNKIVFHEDSLKNNPLEIHYNTLEIIGKRMQNHPDCNISLKGYSDKISENSDCELAKQRAEEVKNYLLKFWKIDESRIEIKSSERCYPKFETLTRNEDGFSENRRVEIESDDYEILKPIKKIYCDSSYLSKVELEFDPTGTDVKNIGSWELTANYDKLSIFSRNGIGMPPIFKYVLPDSLIKKLKNNDKVIVTLKIKIFDGRQATAHDTLIINKITKEKNSDKFSIALFKVSKDILNKIDKKGIADFLKNFNESDTLIITGFTDLLGNPDENMVLSIDRAASVANYITKELKTKNILNPGIFSIGVGFTKKPSRINSYSTPEERFMCRTVQIEKIYNIEKNEP